ncbi:DNA-directed RNA polymerase III subunit RPC3 isoform X2 [Photinus pyralis]|nr:DNA-directed RNA polymerase III subunit RPC3 isoform X2 [Photinus pyralis]
MLNLKNVLLMLRFPKFINLIKTKFDETYEVLVEEILLKGCVTASELIIKVAKRLQEQKTVNILLQELKDNFNSLVTAKYVTRLSTQVTKAEELYLLPNLDLKQILTVLNGENETLSDAGIYWTINSDRFHQDLRDQLIVNSVSNKFDDNMGELIRLLLQQMYVRTDPWVSSSNPIPILEVKDIVKKRNTHPQLATFFEQYVNILEQDATGIIRKVGEASGGSFQVEIKHIFTQLTWEAVEEIVNEKFDSKASRIFRLVKLRHYIEPEQIQNLVMIPAKEVKRILYMLLEENFLVVNELKRSATSLGPSKSFTLFHIRLSQVVRTMLELCYKTLYNIMTRRCHEKYLNKRLIDKKHRVDTITHGMRVQGISGDSVLDIEEMITPPENEILERIGKMMKKLSLTELEIDETLFLLEMYLKYE